MHSNYIPFTELHPITVTGGFCLHNGKPQSYSGKKELYAPLIFFTITFENIQTTSLYLLLNIHKNYDDKILFSPLPIPDH
jgi:hypothetical protein